MGYTITTIDSYVRIMPAAVREAQDAIVTVYGDDADLVTTARDAGFDEATSNPEDGFRLNWMNSKSGAEDDFLDTIAPYVEDGSYITWRGEDDEMWADLFMSGYRVTMDVTIRMEPPRRDLFGPDHQQVYHRILHWIEKQGVK